MIVINSASGVAGSHQLSFSSGTEPVQCYLVDEPAGVQIAVSGADRFISWSSSTANGEHMFFVGCNNCAGSGKAVPVLLRIGVATPPPTTPPPTTPPPTGCVPVKIISA